MTATVCLLLSVVFLVLAVLAGVRRRGRGAVRWFALALVPAGLYLTGLVTMFRKVGSAIGSWASHLVLDPRVWTGFVMLAAAVLLLLATGLLRRRSARGSESSSGGGRTVTSRPSRAAVAPAAKGNVPTTGRGNGGSAREDDFSDIEEILKRRGI